MKQPSKIVLYILGVLILMAVLVGCQSQTPTATAGEPTAVPQTCPTPEACPPDLSGEIPFWQKWQASGHANAEAAAFTHWNTEEPPEIPATCAKCHSSQGFLDYVGADDSEAFKVDANAPVGTVITCNTCHNEATLALDTVKFPSGAELTGLGREAICMTCHQGAASKVQVDEAIQKAGATDEDQVVGELGFINVHYYAAAISRYGSQVKGGYEYEGKRYDVLFEHVAGMQTCTDCHDSHSLEVKVDTCSTCHEGATSVESLRDIRMASSQVDYDGDGNVEEGIYYEVDGLRQMLYQAIQAYASEVAGTPIVYSAEAYPYFFIDTNKNGQADADETQYPNRYNAWTPRLEKAAFNYQVSMKDPGGYAHGAKYIIQLLYDSIESLNEKLSQPVDLSKAHRNDPGHFAGSEEAFRHWDAEGKVPNTCVKCHTAEGLPQYLAEGTNISMLPSNGLRCETCHSSVTTFERYQVESVTFPSGAKLGFADKADANLCLNCHQGRDSTVTVNRAIAGKDPDTVDEKLSFRNVHYFAAGATLFGTEAKGIYEYAGKTYAGPFKHVQGVETCTDCHDAHSLEVKTASCQGCHQVDDPAKIRMTSKADYDGDGDTQEGLKGEVETMKELLYAAIQAYAKDVAGKPIVYSPVAYPYFFVDTNANGQADADEVNFQNRYNAWTPRLLTAAYNYQYAQKDPGGYVHNGVYVLQALYDSLADLGTKVKVDLTKLVRP